MRASKADGSQVLDLQRDALLGAGILADRLYEDHASGKRDDRPGLEACLKALRKDDTLVAWRLDRLGRDLRHLVNLVHELTGRGIGLKVLAGQGANLDTTTANGRLVLGIFAARAELARARAVAGAPGGPPPPPAPGRQAAMGRPGTKVGELCAELGVSRQTLYRHVDPQGVLRTDGERLLGGKARPRQRAALPGQAPAR